MIQGQSVLAVMPARGGSKGVPGKNIRPLGGKPLLAWTCEAVKGCDKIDRFVLTSDSPDIMKVARQWGCEVPYQRPASLAGDHTPSVDVALDLLDRLGQGYDYMVWLQPTSPFRTTQDIHVALDLCHQQGADSLVSVTPTAKSPYWMFHLHENQTLHPVMSQPPPATNRQDLPITYELNGALYVVRIPWFIRERRFFDASTLACIMPSERSLDIDTEDDFLMAEQWLLKKAMND